MTKYQQALLKRAIKKDLSKVFNTSEKKHTRTKPFGPRTEERFLPEYVTNNPWY